jgi:hypothetical protein
MFKSYYGIYDPTPLFPSFHCFDLISCHSRPHSSKTQALPISVPSPSPSPSCPHEVKTFTLPSPFQGQVGVGMVGG